MNQIMSRNTFDSDQYFILSSKIIQKFIGSKKYQKAVEMLFECWQNKGTVFTMGCGGSASTASHFASDLAKTTIVEGKTRFRTICLVDNISLVSAWTNDYGWKVIFSEQLEPWISEKDVLVGFSVHGGSHEEEKSWSQNLTEAMKLAKQRKAKIIGFSGFNGGAMRKLADVNLLVPVSKEPYATALIESIHVVIHHAIIFDLKEKITK